MPKVTILIMPFVLIGILEARTYVDSAVVKKGLRAVYARSWSASR